MMLFCATIRKNSVSLLMSRFSLLCNFVSLSLEIFIQLFFFPFLFSVIFLSDLIFLMLSLAALVSFFIFFNVILDFLKM